MESVVLLFLTLCFIQTEINHKGNCFAFRHVQMHSITQPQHWFSFQTTGLTLFLCMHPQKNVKGEESCWKRALWVSVPLAILNQRNLNGKGSQREGEEQDSSTLLRTVLGCTVQIQHSPTTCDMRPLILFLCSTQFCPELKHRDSVPLQHTSISACSFELVLLPQYYTVRYFSSLLMCECMYVCMCVCVQQST